MFGWTQLLSLHSTKLNSENYLYSDITVSVHTSFQCVWEEMDRFYRTGFSLEYSGCQWETGTPPSFWNEDDTEYFFLIFIMPVISMTSSNDES